MKYFIIFFICLRTLLFASFFEEEDLNHYYHVNVITGHLDLNFEDLCLKGPIPFSISRSYTSAGALERSEDDLDLLLKNLRKSGWMFQGGWGILPHTNLLIQADLCHGQHKAYLCEKNSTTLIPYTYFKKKKGMSYLRPKFQSAKVSGNLSARKQSKYNVLKIAERSAILRLPDLTERHYSGNVRENNSYWRLDLEILPSKHRIIYHYSNDVDDWRYPGNLLKIELQNPSGTKTFASIDFDHSHFKEDRELHATTSYGKTISYQLGPDFKERTYLQNAKSAFRGKETYIYHPGRKGIGARVSAVSVEEREQFRVEYHLPPTKQKAKKWARNPRKHQQGDKVRALLFPDPKTGEFVEVARFTYLPDYTEIVDHEGVSTRYYHDETKLLAVEYSDPQGNLHSKIAFEWKDDHLRSKKLLSGDNRLLYSKSFFYDAIGNVVEECWEDPHTHTPPLHRKLSYSKYRLVVREEEVEGLTHDYTYLHKTDLPTRKLTQHKGKILSREFWFYNDDYLLVGHICDDGVTPNPGDLTGVTERKIENYDLDPATGLCLLFTQSHFDKDTLSQQIFLQHSYTYNDQRDITSETIHYGPHNESRTLYYEYDSLGHLIKKTTPLGRENTYSYDHFGNLITSKEVKSPQKIFTYDFANRPIECREVDKVIHSRYDIKGRLLSQTDGYDNETTQYYDCFGRCVKTVLPQTLDADGVAYTPIIEAGYDVQNNLIHYTNPKGETTTTQYNLLRKPVMVHYPDLRRLHHEYNRDGTIAKTLLADQTEIHFTYDPFQRITSKKIQSSEGDIFSEESWVYNTFHLLSYTNAEGLTTHYTYDGLGRKISEQAQERLITYSYDALGFLEKVTEGGISRIQKYNVEGEVIEQWEENSKGKIENHMVFVYDQNGRKTKAYRITSEGTALDTFEYDAWGRLTTHTDPQGEKRHFLYTHVRNKLGQLVEPKTTLDPLGNGIVETPDANGHVTAIEKIDSQNQILGREEFFYDLAGNKAKRIVTIFDHTTSIRTHTTLWQHNPRGLVTEEIEEGEKKTLFSYDQRGRLVQKTLPCGTVIRSTYDCLDRLLKLKSSDHTLNYTYSYHRGSHPIEATDHIRHQKWTRTYTLFGQLATETLPNQLTTCWTYDSQGRCTSLTLPDQSSIHYTYADQHLEKVSRYDSHHHFQYAHSYTQYDQNGHVAEESLIHNLGTITTAHDLLERPCRTITPWHTAHITYGPSGLVTKIENSLFKPKEYQYDSLNQLVKEQDQTYTFDSLGNPLNSAIGPLNQILSTPTHRYIYNENGNPSRELSFNKAITYTYDALNRLTTLQITGEKHIQYVYDPFGRLYAKETSQNTPSYFSNSDLTYYLYDQDIEIGTTNAHGAIRDLKVIGLGILGDIGAAIALELDSKAYLPLHDFTGSIIALISSDGALVEKTDLDAFGHTLLTTSSLSPWRFHSKRTEEHLIFFGERFYDPHLGRWLTPDPAGSIESPNLYLFVLNCPLNRLDLFGLYSEELYTEVTISSLIDNSSPYVECTTYCGELQADWLIYCNHFHRLQFSPEELKTGKIDIFEHFQDLFEKEGFGLGLITYQNGILNEPSDHRETTEMIAPIVPKDGVFISMYTPTRGLLGDINSVRKERKRKETPEVIVARQALIAISETLDRVAPKVYWAHINHSRAGLIGCCAIEGMSKEEKDLLSEKMIWMGIAPAEPLDKEFSCDSINIYSKMDCATGPAAIRFNKTQKHLPPSEQRYNIQFVDCTSTKKETTFFGDHSVMGTTYRKAIEDSLNARYRKYGIYKEKR